MYFAVEGFSVPIIRDIQGRVTGFVAATEAQAAKAEIARLRADPDFLSRYFSDNPDITNLAQQQMLKLHEVAFGTEPFSSED